jgi:phage shock protein PspC (stress-responsive transcriptional regulator)
MLFVPSVPPPIPGSVLRVYAADPVKYSGYYKSSDDKSVAGVCAGLAHKMKISKGGLQAAFVLLGLLWLVGVVFYIICWLTFPALPTKNVQIATS